MGRYYIHVIDGEHTILDETGGEFANVHQIRQHGVESPKSLIQERLQDRSQWSACHFLMANEKGPSQPRIPLTAWLDSDDDREPAEAATSSEQAIGLDGGRLAWLVASLLPGDL